MTSPPLSVRIQIAEPGRQVQQVYPASPSDTLAELFGRVARDHGLTGPQAEWMFRLNGQPLNWASTVGEASQLAGDPEVLALTLTRIAADRAKAEGAGGDWGEADAPAPSRGGGMGGFAGPAPGAPPAPAARPAPSPALPPPTTERRREQADSAVLSEESVRRKRSESRPEAPARTYRDEVEAEADEDDDIDTAGISRQATVRYYHRMNPQRVYPFLVVLSKEEIAEIVQGGVKQATGDRFVVETESPVEVEPVLPGCQVYPPKHTLVIGPDTQTLEFWVVPQVLGTVKGAKVIVRQDGDTLSEVKLEAKVVQQTAAMVVGVLSFVMPYVTKTLKADNPDGSPVQGALNWVATNLRPEAIWAGLALAAVGLYFWCRPRKRDQFWDVTPKRS